MGSRRCTDCGHAASDRARFCERCGSALVPGATPLRAPHALETRILTERTAIEGERKQVTVMYTDIVGSMELTRSMDSERWGLILDRFLAITAGAVHSYEGTVNQFTGDGLMAVFGAPLAHEDHARRACLAVLELQREVGTLAAEVARSDGVEFSIRCGLNSGEVVVGAIGDDVHMDFVPVGNTTALGKRIEELAPVGSTAISAATAALVEGQFEVRELGAFEVKGAEVPQRVLELLAQGAAQTRLQAVAASRGLSRFVGRDAERAALESALELALASDGRAVGIVGDPGVGKSRLVHEFVTGCTGRGLAVHSTGGVPHGRYVPFLPVLALYRDYLGIDERDAPEIARQQVESTMLALDPAFADDLQLLYEFLGISVHERPPAMQDPVAHRRGLLAAATRALTARSRHEAVVLVLEDLHWFDDASDAFLEELVEAVIGTRILLVATYRPGYDDRWTRDEPHARLDTAPLDGAATEDLLTALLGRDSSLGGLSSLIEARTGGNPFFIEEVVQALVENGHLTGTRGAYLLGAEPEGLVLPATVQAGLAARIDRLPSREKALVQTMSVIGKEVPAPLLQEVSDLDANELAQAVSVLESGQWVIRRGSPGRREYVFKHPLTQEVAYRSQLSQWRERAHRRVTAGIERIYPETLDERAALLAHHCEAGGDRVSAAGWHARAAAWAELASPADGIRHWRRVRHLLGELEPSPELDELAARARMGMLSLGWRLGMSPDERASVYAETKEDVERLRLDLYYSGILMHSGREREGLEGFRRISRGALAAGDPGLALTASTGVAYASWLAGSLSEGVETIDHALPLVADAPTAASGLVFVSTLAHAFQSRGMCRGYSGELDQARTDFDRALELAREQVDPQTESASHANQALLEAAVEDYQAALHHAARGLAIAEPLDAIHRIACSVPAAVAQSGMGRFADAIVRAEADLATVREHQIGVYFEPLLLATIARSKLALGEADAALAAAEEAVDIADVRGLATCALTAPITLAQVLIALQGAAAGARIESVLARAMLRARESGARVFEPQIHRELAALARARAGDVSPRRGATAPRVRPVGRT